MTEEQREARRKLRKVMRDMEQAAEDFICHLLGAVTLEQAETHVRNEMLRRLPEKVMLDGVECYLADIETIYEPSAGALTFNTVYKPTNPVIVMNARIAEDLGTFDEMPGMPGETAWRGY
jgi:hypothetical protein